jgi:lysophospholipase
MVTHRFSSADHTPLCADFYEPDPVAGQGQPRGTIVVVHGYCEHRGRYQRTAQDLARQGYRVIVGDLRGHGEAGGQRAHVDRFEEYLDDTVALLAQAARHAQGGPPPFLLGHSMGGLVALRYVQERAREGDLQGLILSSPLLGIKVQVPAWKRLLGQAASLTLPGLSLPNDLDPALLSHDPEIGRAYATDPLVSHVATARWFTEAQLAQLQALRRAPGVRLPVLLLQAGDDRIVDQAASQALFERLGGKDKVFTLYPGLFHEIFNEVERDRVLADVVSWLHAHQSAPSPP